MVLANYLMSDTTTFGAYIVELYARIMEGNYAAALLVSEAMVQHEAMLHEIAAGKPLRYGSTIN